MIKETPSLGRIAAMTAFALSCFGLLVFLWLAFGGPIPLKPQSYRFEASFKEAALLVKEADVRIAGLNVGKVKDKRLDKANGATIAELEIDPKYDPPSSSPSASSSSTRPCRSAAGSASPSSGWPWSSSPSRRSATAAASCGWWPRPLRC